MNDELKASLELSNTELNTLSLALFERLVDCKKKAVEGHPARREQFDAEAELVDDLLGKVRAAKVQLANAHAEKFADLV